MSDYVFNQSIHVTMEFHTVRIFCPDQIQFKEFFCTWNQQRVDKFMKDNNLADYVDFREFCEPFNIPDYIPETPVLIMKKTSKTIAETMLDFYGDVSKIDIVNKLL
jgi:hypothetical protein